MRTILTFALAALLLSATSLRAADPTRSELLLPVGKGSYGSGVWLQALVTYDEICPGTALLPEMQGTLTLKRAGVVEEADRGFFRAFYRECSQGRASAGQDFFVKGLPFGRHSFTLEYSGGGRLAPSVSSEVAVEIVPDFTRPLPSGGDLLVGAADPNLGEGFYCRQRDVQPLAGGTPPPAGVRFEDGVLRYAFSTCRYQCGFLCPPDVPSYPAQRLMLQFPQPVPADATFLIRAERGGGAPPAWQPLQATIEGSQVAFVLEGENDSIEMHGEIAMARGDAPYGVQDFWWGGPAENGWGVNIAQSGDQLFAAFYIYRDDGTPVWVAMPSGRWDAARRVFEGDVYIPAGSPFYAYDASRLRMGAPVGQATLRFAGRESATLEYAIAGRTGSKALVRFPISPRPLPVAGPESGLWWGGPAHNGTGISISHQERGWFVSWYTYDAEGQPTWFFGSLDAVSAAGKLFSAHGSPWLGTRYDPGRLAATEVGTVRFSFQGPLRGRGLVDYTVGGRSGRIPIERFPF